MWISLLLTNNLDLDIDALASVPLDRDAGLPAAELLHTLADLVSDPVDLDIVPRQALELGNVLRDIVQRQRTVQSRRLRRNRAARKRQLRRQREELRQHLRRRLADIRGAGSGGRTRAGSKHGGVLKSVLVTRVGASLSSASILAIEAVPPRLWSTHRLGDERLSALRRTLPRDVTGLASRREDIAHASGGNLDAVDCWSALTSIEELLHRRTPKAQVTTTGSSVEKDSLPPSASESAGALLRTLLSQSGNLGQKLDDDGVSPATTGSNGGGLMSAETTNDKLRRSGEKADATSRA